MGIHRGPNIVKDDLVFGYDTGYGVADNSTATRFYAGKSVDNEFYNSGANGNILDHSSGYGGYGTVQTGVLDASGTTQNAVYRKTGKIRFGPTGGQDIGTLTNGNTYTFSIYLRHVAGQTESTSMEFDIVDQSSGGYNYTGTLGSNMTYEWKRFSVTSTHTNSSNYHFIDLGTYQGTNVFEWCMPQIESGTVASPFTSTERSSTQSLIDLKRTADIDVSNVSFNSTGQPEFDGTDDRISMGDTSFTDFGTGNFTIEAVLYIPSDITTSTGHYKGVVVKKGASSANAGMGIYYNTGHQKFLWSTADGTSGVERFTTNTFGHLLGTYIHVIMVRDSNTTNNGHFYINGVQEAISSGGSLMNVNNNYNLLVGASSTLYSLYYLEGEIPVAKIYSKALTATEAKQNYNAYKNRFNI